jgi:hypothetical protein
MPSKKQRAKAEKKAKDSLKGETPERYDVDNQRSLEIFNVCRAHIWVQKTLGRPFGKINMLVITNEGDDWLYGEESKEGFAMFETKLRGLEVEYPNMCQNWWQMFMFQMVSSNKYSPENGIRDDARYFFCCCVADDGSEVRGFKMERGNYMSFFDTQEKQITDL